MPLLTYRAVYPDNLYRLTSLGGHTSEDAQQSLDFIFADPKEKLAFVLDLQNGLSLFPKEQNLVFARTASGFGVKKIALAILVSDEETDEVSNRYLAYPAMVEEFLDLDVQIFSDESKATDWVLSCIA